jgi:hypothetical protein
MKDTNTSTMQGPTVKPPGLTNDFSEQEETMTASLMPPAFALTAGAMGQPANDSGKIPPTQQDALQRLGLSEAEIADLDAKTARNLLAASTRFAPEEWAQLWPTIKELGLVAQMPAILEDFYEKGNWLTSPSAVSLAVFEGFSYTNADGKRMGGFLELAQEGDRIGIRAIVPYDDFGQTLILNPKKTTTVLGRAVDAAKHPDGYKGAMNAPIGTNYFRFQQNARVGENQGGTNVLDIADWSWAKNNAWLQAAVDRGDIIRFVSDPILPTTLFKEGTDIDKGLTITGDEVGVLLNKGFAPEKATGIVGPYSSQDFLLFPEFWMAIMEKVEKSGRLKDIDPEAYSRFRFASELPAMIPQKDKGSGEIQTNFFGGSPKQLISAT